MWLLNVPVATVKSQLQCSAFNEAWLHLTVFVSCFQWLSAILKKIYILRCMNRSVSLLHHVSHPNGPYYRRTIWNQTPHYMCFTILNRGSSSALRPSINYRHISFCRTQHRIPNLPIQAVLDSVEFILY